MLEETASGFNSFRPSGARRASLHARACPASQYGWAAHRQPKALEELCTAACREFLRPGLTVGSSDMSVPLDCRRRPLCPPVVTASRKGRYSKTPEKRPQDQSLSKRQEKHDTLNVSQALAPMRDPPEKVPLNE